jgi:hypothetical protein
MLEDSKGVFYRKLKVLKDRLRVRGTIFNGVCWEKNDQYLTMNTRFELKNKD